MDGFTAFLKVPLDAVAAAATHYEVALRQRG